MTWKIVKTRKGRRIKMNCVTEVVWKDIPEQVEYEEFVDKIIQTCFKVEKIDPTLFYICVTLTNPENIRKYN